VDAVVAAIAGKAVHKAKEIVVRVRRSCLMVVIIL